MGSEVPTGPKEEIALTRQSSSEQCDEDVKSTDGHSNEKVLKVNVVFQNVL